MIRIYEDLNLLHFHAFEEQVPAELYNGMLVWIYYLHYQDLL